MKNVMKVRSNFFNLLGSLGLTSLVVLTSTAFSAPSYAPGNYEIDPMHSKVGFEVPHLVISSVEGRFDEYQGSFTLAESLPDSQVSFTIDTASIDTANKKRDTHLRNADFFDVTKFPKITFKSKKVTGTPENFQITGDLTVKNITKTVTFEGKFLGNAKDGYGNLKSAFQAGTKISRKAFGLTWNSLVEAGPMVGDEVTISVKLQGAKVDTKSNKA